MPGTPGKGETVRPAASVLLLALVLASGCAAPAPDPEPVVDRPVSPTAERPMDSVALIDGAVRGGRLDYSDRSSLQGLRDVRTVEPPPGVSERRALKCGTALIQEVQRNWHVLTTEQRNEISPYIQPVGDPDKTDTQLDAVSPDRMESERDKID